MKILVTGTDGYIGSILGPYLLEDGHDVLGLDTGYYRSGWLYNDKGKRYPSFINKDLRDIEAADLEGLDAVVHLAELSNDPLGQLNPEITYGINHRGSVKIAELCKKAGVERFVYASSCSVYGIGSDEHKTEESEVNPQTAYAECKVRVERDVSRLADEGFSPSFLRNATAFGPSPRMRFDIALNNLAGLAWTTGEIAMTSDGMPWRPLVHVNDICKAVLCTLNAPREAIHNQIFNVGETRENFRVKEIAEIVSDAFPGCRISFGNNGGDNRSYRVSFDKIHEELPGFSCEYDAEKGARQLSSLFSRIGMDADVFESRNYTRLKQLQYLLSKEQIDDNFNWM